MSLSYLTIPRVASEAVGPLTPGSSTNVIPFPRRESGSQVRDDLAALTITIAAIAALGEPATLAEIVDTVAQCSALPPSGDRIERVLLAWSEPQGCPVGHSLFQAVLLGDRGAWAFTANLRRVLRGQGVSMRLRGLGDLPQVQP